MINQHIHGLVDVITRHQSRCGGWVVAVNRHASLGLGEGPGAEPKNGNGDVSDATVCVHILRLSGVPTKNFQLNSGTVSLFYFPIPISTLILGAI